MTGQSTILASTQVSDTAPVFATVGKPPDEVVSALIAGVVKLHRRVEIYERDGVTPFAIDRWNARLVTGSITVDGTRDERRMCDLTLDNGDEALNLNPYGGFYYDKILKVFWGIEYYSQRAPQVIQTTSKNMLSSDGTFESGVSNWFATACTFTSSTAQSHTGFKSGLITTIGGSSQAYVRSGQAYAQPNQQYFAGMWVYCSVSRNVTLTFDWFDITQANYIQTTSLTTVGVNANTWTYISGNFTAPSTPGIASFSAGPTLGSTPAAGILLYIDDFTLIGPGVVTIPGAENGVLKRWEMQLGEFMIDQIDEERFPYQAQVTGRDYTKKCLMSDLTTSLSYDNTFTVDQIITGLMGNAGITKFRMPATGLTFNDDTVFAVGASRWSVIKAVADAVGYEVYFTPDGYATMRLIPDPVTSPLSYVFKPGKSGGTLVAYKRSSDDSLLKNHMIVIGATVTDDLGISTTAYGEAINDDPSSPTRREIMGDRVNTFTSDYITATQDAQALAIQMLRVQGLEEFSVSFSSLVIPWLEANDIIQVINPNESVDVPTRFLYSSFTLSLDLGPMQGVAKRVTLIGTTVTNGAQA